MESREADCSGELVRLVFGLPERARFRVSPEWAERGRRGSPATCPVALSLKERFPLADWSVGHNVIEALVECPQHRATHLLAEYQPSQPLREALEALDGYSRLPFPARRFEIRRLPF
jgi:hypothetical protein